MEVVTFRVDPVDLGHIEGLPYWDNKDYNINLAKQVVYNEVLFGQLEKDVGFKSLSHLYREVMDRDYLAFNQEDFNVELYATVLLYQGEYYGHVYCWRSPVNETRVLVMGIRSRLDSYRLPLRGISSILLEGVRRYACCIGSSFLCIVRPIGVMLKKMKELVDDEIYQNISLTGLQIGISISDFHSHPDFEDIYHYGNQRIDQIYQGPVDFLFSYDIDVYSYIR
jgi:hypothetical protein